MSIGFSVSRGSCVLLLALLATCATSVADEVLITRMTRLASHYHEDVSQLDAGRDELEAAVKRVPSVQMLVVLARICYVWGDVRATPRDAKLASFGRGRDVANQAFELEPENTEARYWRAVNLGRWVETKGMFSALAEVASLRDEMNVILRRHPDYTPAYGFLGSYYSQVPWLLGGDLNKARKMFDEGLALDPHGTGQRVGLAKTLIQQKNIIRARAELQRVLDEKMPSNPAEWTLRDAPEARRLLRTLGDSP
jgi:hypothetical protein